MNLNKIKEFKTGFKQFIGKGDIVKLSIAFIMSQLFTKIISSLTVDIIMPPINLLLNKQYSIKEWKLNLNSEISINYGNFIQNIFEFLLVSLTIYTILVYFCQKVFQKNNENEIQQKKIKLETEEKIEKIEKEKIIILKEIREILKNLKEIKN